MEGYKSPSLMFQACVCEQTEMKMNLLLAVLKSLFWGLCQNDAGILVFREGRREAA